MDLSSYHTQTQILWEELSNIQTTPHTVEDLLAEKETNRVIDFLMGLNDSYDNLRSRILMKNSLPSLSEIYNLLDQDDSQKSVTVAATSDFSIAAFQVSHSQSQGFSKSAQAPTSQNASAPPYQRNNRPQCIFCGKAGHVVDKCWKKHGYPTSFKPNIRSDKPSPLVANVALEEGSSDPDTVTGDLSATQIQQLMTFLASKLQPPSSTPTPEVHSVSIFSALPSSTIGPMSGSYSGINDWDG